MKFRYTKFPTRLPNRPWVSRPFVPIRLYGPDGSVLLDALVDSGADRCLFHEDVGRAIGLDVPSGPTEEFMGIEGSRVPVYLHTVRLSLDGAPGDIELLAGFTPSKGVGAILGQEGFFDAFKVTFERSRGMVEIASAKAS